jgi:hypothetical protein
MVVSPSADASNLLSPATPHNHSPDAECAIITHSAAARLTECHHAVSPGAFGALERFIRRLQDLFRGPLFQAFSDTDANR